MRFEGHYHGWMDTVYWSNHPDPSVAGPAERPVPVAAGRGMLPEVADSLVILSWNDPESFETVMAELGDQIAAVITEPVMLNTGCILPEPGFLQLLRDRTREHGALLIFDEVMTGFRLAWGGVQNQLGIRPDLTTLGKVIGGGLPLAAVGGRRDIMQQLAPVGAVYQAGTLSGNPLAVAAGLVTLDHLDRPGTYEQLEQRGAQLESGLRAALAKSGRTGCVSRRGSMWTLFFGVDAVRNADDARRSDTAAFGRFFTTMLERGVYLPPSQFEAAFISLAHSEDDIERTVQAANEALEASG
jgi:glutamate-1-semialdehyde 2,1-aminomutase